MELAHELGEARAVVRLPGPRPQGIVRRLQELRSFLAEHGGDFNVHLLAPLLARRLGGNLGHGRSCLGLRLELELELRLECSLEVFDARRQRAEVAGIGAGAVDGGDDGLHRRSHVGAHGAACLAQLAAVLVEVAHVAVERSGNLHGRSDTGHVGATVESVARPVQRLGDRIRRGMLVTVAQISLDHAEMPAGLLGEDLLQDRVHGRLRGGLSGLRIGLRHLRHRLPTAAEQCGEQTGSFRTRAGESACRGYQALNVNRRRRSRLELLHQLRQRPHGHLEEPHHLGRADQRAVDEPVEKVLHRPGELADELGAHHPAAALQGVKRAPDCHQRLEVVGILCPHGKLLADGGDLLLGLLDEELDELGVEPIGLVRLAGSVGRGLGLCGGRLPGHHRRLSVIRLVNVRGRGFLGLLELDRTCVIRCLHHRLEPGAFEGSQRPEASLRVVEHVPGVPPPILHRLHVVLDAHNGIGETVQPGMWERALPGLQTVANDSPDPLHDLHGAALAQHQEPGGDAPELLRDGVHRMRFLGFLQGLDDCFLHPRQVHDALADDRRGDLAEVDVALVVADGFLRRVLEPGLPGRRDEIHEFLVEPVLHLQQDRRDLHQGGFFGRNLAVHDALQPADLRHDSGPEIPQAEHAERVRDLLEHLELGLELLHRLHARAHVDVEHVLDARQVLLDGSRDGFHQLDAGGREALASAFDLVVCRQQLAQAEGLANGADTLARGAGTGHVVEQVIEQLRHRPATKARLAFIDEAFDLQVGLGE